jgi:hypothetical protein
MSAYSPLKGVAVGVDKARQHHAIHKIHRLFGRSNRRNPPVTHHNLHARLQVSIHQHPAWSKQFLSA